MKLEVWHATKNMFFPDACEHIHVADVEVQDGLTDIDALESAFRLTNNIDSTWWTNKDVVRLLPNQTRSTSVGDIVVLNGERWKVAMLGWNNLDKEGETNV